MKKYLPFIVAAVLFLLGGVDFARADNCAAYPYTLQNNQVADANQVMANFNNVLGCGNNSLLGKNNNLSDLQNVPTARSNLGLGASAVENLSNTTIGAVTDDGSGNLISHVASMHEQTLSVSGVFTVPSGTTSSTVFQFDVVGAGGGGGAEGANSVGGGGASGGAGSIFFSGFTAGASVTVTIGAGGAGTIGAGSNGGTTTLAYNANTIVSCSGGAGGPTSTNAAVSAAAPGSCSVSVGTSGLTLLGSHPGGMQPGGLWAGISITSVGGNGGGNAYGTGGTGASSSGATNRQGGDGSFGGGGGGSYGGASVGGAGGNGIVNVKWVL